MWIFKYKPKTFRDYNYHTDIINTIRNNLENLSNMIFFGPPGSGKTTLSDIIINHIYKTRQTENVLKLNASDERGVNIIKDKVLTFCKKKINGNFDYKIIILDEADMLTFDAQNVLRKIIEDYELTKFIFICNYENKIINPINSRCLKLYFPNITYTYVKKLMITILKKENKIINEELNEIILKKTNGDLRKTVIFLETFYNILNINDHLDKINLIIGDIEEDYIAELFKDLSISNIDSKIKEVILSSHSIKNFINIYMYFILNNHKDSDISEDKKKKIFIRLSKYDNMLFMNIDKELLLRRIFLDYILF